MTDEAPASPPGWRSQHAWMLAVPVAIGSAMLLGGVAWVVTVFGTDGVARGPQVDVVVSDTCATAEIDARLAEYGLPGTWTGATLRLTLPGARGDEAVPAALAAPGKLEMTFEGKPLEARLLNAGVQIDTGGTPVSLYTFDTAIPAGVVVTLDGAAMTVASANGNELMLAAYAGHSTDALRLATDRVVQVRHPLPCEPQIVSVTPVGG